MILNKNSTRVKIELVYFLTKDEIVISRVFEGDDSADISRQAEIFAEDNNVTVFFKDGMK